MHNNVNNRISFAGALGLYCDNNWIKAHVTIICIMINCIFLYPHDPSVTFYKQQFDAKTDSSLYYQINDSLTYKYIRPKRFGFIKNSLLDIYQSPQEIIKRKNLPAVTGVVLSSAITMYYDDKIYESSRRFGKYIGLSDRNPTYNISPASSVTINFPASFSSVLYYIGDGITELSVNGAFYLYGKIKNDARALATASELAEGFLAVGFYVQVLKHATGHETPAKRTTPRGRWRWFPTLKEYHGSVPKYDAFPSGHLAMAMMTTTVVSLNYPEYRFIKPLCYSLIAVCGYQMINNGVHWMGDYPFALAMGYCVGKMAVERGRIKISSSDEKTANLSNKNQDILLSIRPAYFGFDATGVTLNFDF
jgi:hypothetical protein